MKDTVFGGIYQVDEEELSQLDDYVEGRETNLYDRKSQIIIHEQGKTKAYIYVMAKQNKSMLKTAIPSGDWVCFQNDKT